MSAVFAVLLGLMITVVPIILERLLWGTGPVWFGSWPTELQLLLDELPDDVRNDTSGVKAYCLGGMFEWEYVWRFHIPKAGFDKMLSVVEMKKISKLEPDDRFWHEGPSWWTPDPNADAEFFVPSDPNSIGAVLMYDAKREIIFGRNFALD